MIGLVRRRGAHTRNDETTTAHGQEAAGDQLAGVHQSLADGQVAQLLLAVEDALTSRGSWQQAEELMAAAWGSGPDCSPQAGLFAGAPALGFAVETAGPQGRARWAHELTVLDEALAGVATSRLAAAESRAGAGTAIQSSEFDLVHGLAGLAVVLLRRTVQARTERSGHAEALGGVLEGVLAYLVDRATDRVLDQVRVPGWWSPQAPGPSGGNTPLSGNADLGMAHGGAGILAVLAAAHRARITVPGQEAAIGHISGWYHRWQQQTPGGVVWWPGRLTLEHLRTGRVSQTVPPAPSWASGTPGIGRALQMAAIALGDEVARVAAENAIASCLTRSQLDQLRLPDLFAGTGGMYLTVLRAAGDCEAFRRAGAGTVSMLPHRLGLAAHAVSRTSHTLPDDDDTAFLYGQFGTRLVLESLRARTVPVGGGDGVLGIGWAS